ncbi:hypothetical protein [Ehrlichia ruminantium]|uniref:hypothetical protein n=1 Tax=Ehrlichia ruminantium TaxID=779 RepID=UPI00004A0A2E|nr:hypothetical protein [Ehrlichia ruminantium]CAH57778.1 hypothetical protein Erum0660 [Ehrlichia ruminantium str. Welgevonden]
MLNQKLDMAYIERLINQQPRLKVVNAETVSLSYSTVWDYIFNIGLVQSIGYNAYVKNIRAYHPDYNVFHGVILCNPQVFLEEIKIPGYGGILSKIQKDYPDCESLELYILNGYVLSVLVNDPLFEQFKSKITSIKMGDIDLFQQVYDDLKQNPNGHSEEDIDFLVRGVMTDTHIRKYISLFPSLKELDCVISEPKCCETLVDVLNNVPILSQLSLRCARTSTSVEHVSKKDIKVRQQVEKLLLINCPMETLLYFHGIRFLFITAPQNVSDSKVILLEKYCDNPSLLEVLLVSTNTYHQMQDGRIDFLSIDYDISVFNNLKLLIINPCQDIRAILSVDGLFDSKAGLDFCNELVTPRKYSTLFNNGKPYPKSIEQVMILSSSLHQFSLLTDSEKLLIPGLTSLFVSTTVIRPCLDINTLVPYLMYAVDSIQDGIINPHLNEQENVLLISLINQVKRKVDDLLLTLLEDSRLCDDLASYLKRVEFDNMVLTNASSVYSLSYEPSLLFAINIDIPRISIEFLKKISNINLAILCKINLSDDVNSSTYLALTTFSAIRSIIRYTVGMSKFYVATTMRAWDYFINSMAIGDRDLDLARVISAIFVQPYDTDSVRNLCRQTVVGIKEHSEITYKRLEAENVDMFSQEQQVVEFIASSVVFHSMYLIITNSAEGLETQSCAPSLFIETLRDNIVNVRNNSLFDILEFDDCLLQIHYIIKKSFNHRPALTSNEVYTFASQCMINEEMLLQDVKNQGFNKIDIRILKSSLFLIKVLDYIGHCPDVLFDQLQSYQLQTPMMIFNVIFKAVCDLIKIRCEYMQANEYTIFTLCYIINKAISNGSISERQLHKLLFSVIVDAVPQIASDVRYIKTDIHVLIGNMIKLCYFDQNCIEDKIYQKVLLHIACFIVNFSITAARYEAQSDCFIDETLFLGFPDDVIDEIRLLGGIPHRSILQVLARLLLKNYVWRVVEGVSGLNNSDYSWVCLQNMMRYKSPYNIQYISFLPTIRDFEFLYSGIVCNTYLPSKIEFEFAIKCLYPVISSGTKYICESMSVVMADLLLKRMICSYANAYTIEEKKLMRKLLLRALYKFQEYEVPNFIEYMIKVSNVFDYEIEQFIYEEPLLHDLNFVWILKNIKPSEIINVIDENIAEYRETNDHMKLYDMIEVSIRQSYKVPNLPSMFTDTQFIKCCGKILNVISEVHSQQDHLSNNHFIEIMQVVMTTYKISMQKPGYLGNCILNVKYCRDKVGGVLEECQDGLDKVVSCLSNDNKVIDIIAIKDDLLSKCQDVKFIKTLNYRTVALYLKPYMVPPVQYSSDIVSHIIFCVVGEIIEQHNKREIFFSQLTSALMLKKKLNTMQSVSEVVLEVFIKSLESNEEVTQGKEVSSTKQSKQKKISFDAYINDLLNKYFCKWWYTILDNMLAGESLNHSIDLYTLKLFISEENLPVKVELALQNKIENEETNQYLVLINKFKSICFYQGSATSYFSDCSFQKRVLHNIITKIRYPATSSDKISVLSNRVIEQGSILLPEELDHGKLQLSGKLYCATGTNDCHIKYIHLLQVRLFSEFFYHNHSTLDIDVLDEKAYEVLSISNASREFDCNDVVGFFVNIPSYLQDGQLDGLDPCSPKVINVLGLSLVWETVSMLLHDLVFGNYLNDISRILCYVEDRFRIENQIDSSVVLLIKFHYKAILFRYEKGNYKDNHPIIFLHKFLQSFNYDLLEHYAPGCRVSLQPVKKQSEVVTTEASSELVKKANKKKSHSKKGKDKEVKQAVPETQDEKLVSGEDDKKSQAVVEKQLCVVHETVGADGVHLNPKDQDECYEGVVGDSVKLGDTTARLLITTVPNNECLEQQDKPKVKKSVSHNKKKSKKSTAGCSTKTITSQQDKVNKSAVVEDVASTVLLTGDDIKVSEPSQEQCVDEKGKGKLCVVDTSGLVVSGQQGKDEESSIINKAVKEVVPDTKDEKLASSGKKSKAVSTEGQLCVVPETADVDHVPLNPKGQDEYYEGVVTDSVKLDDFTAGQLLITTVLNDEYYEAVECDGIKVNDSTVSRSLVDPVSDDQYVKQGAKPKVKGSLSHNKRKKSKKSTEICATSTVKSQKDDLDKSAVVTTEKVDNTALLASVDVGVSELEQEKFTCEKDEYKFQIMEDTNAPAVLDKQQDSEEKYTIDDTSKVLLESSHITEQDYGLFISEESITQLCTSDDTLNLVDGSSQSLEACKDEQTVDDVAGNILQGKEKKQSQLTKSQRQRANKKARKIKEQKEMVDVQKDKPELVECSELKTEEEDTINLLSCFDARVEPVIAYHPMSLEYVLNKYRVTNDSMSKTRFSHLLYYLRLTRSLFMPVKGQETSVLVVTESAEKVLHDFFPEKGDYDFFLSIIKLSILTNFLMIIRPHSKFEAMTALFKHCYKIFTMDLDAFLCDLIQEMYCISFQDVSLEKLRNHVLKVFEKYESQFCWNRSSAVTKYPLYFLSRVLSICPLIFQAQHTSVSELQHVICNAGIICIVTHIGHMVQQIGHMVEQSDGILYNNLKLLRRSGRSSGTVFDFIQQCYYFRNASCHLYDGKGASSNLNFFRTTSIIVDQFQVFIQNNNGSFIDVIYDFFRQYDDVISKKSEICSKQQSSISVIEVDATKLAPRVINHEESTEGLFTELSNSGSSLQMQECFPEISKSLSLGSNDVIRDTSEEDVSSKGTEHQGDALALMETRGSTSTDQVIDSVAVQEQEYQYSYLLQNLALQEKREASSSYLAQSASGVGDSSAVQYESVSGMFSQFSEDDLQNMRVVNSTSQSKIPATVGAYSCCDETVPINPSSELYDNMCMGSQRYSNDSMDSTDRWLAGQGNNYSMGANSDYRINPESQKSTSSIMSASTSSSGFSLQQGSANEEKSGVESFGQDLQLHHMDSQGECGLLDSAWYGGGTDYLASTNSGVFNFQESSADEGSSEMLMKHYDQSLEHRQHSEYRLFDSTHQDSVDDGNIFSLRRNNFDEISNRVVGGRFENLPDTRMDFSYEERLRNLSLHQGDGYNDVALASNDVLGLRQEGPYRMDRPVAGAFARNLSGTQLDQSSDRDIALASSNVRSLQQELPHRMDRLVAGDRSENLPHTHMDFSYEERLRNLSLHQGGGYNDVALASNDVPGLPQEGPYRMDRPVAGAFARNLSGTQLDQSSDRDIALASSNVRSLQQELPHRMDRLVAGGCSENLPHTHMDFSYEERLRNLSLHQGGGYNDVALASSNVPGLRQEGPYRMDRPVAGGCSENLPHTHMDFSYEERLRNLSLHQGGGYNDVALASSNVPGLQQELSHRMDRPVAGAFARNLSGTQLDQSSDRDIALASSNVRSLQQELPHRMDRLVAGGRSENLPHTHMDFSYEERLRDLSLHRGDGYNDVALASNDVRSLQQELPHRMDRLVAGDRSENLPDTRMDFSYEERLRNLSLHQGGGYNDVALASSNVPGLQQELSHRMDRPVAGAFARNLSGTQLDQSSDRDVALASNDVLSPSMVSDLITQVFARNLQRNRVDHSSREYRVHSPLLYQSDDSNVASVSDNMSSLQQNSPDRVNNPDLPSSYMHSSREYRVHSPLLYQSDDSNVAYVSDNISSLQQNSSDRVDSLFVEGCTPSLEHGLVGDHDELHNPSLCEKRVGNSFSSSVGSRGPRFYKERSHQLPRGPRFCKARSHLTTHLASTELSDVDYQSGQHPVTGNLIQNNPNNPSNRRSRIPLSLQNTRVSKTSSRRYVSN